MSAQRETVARVIHQCLRPVNMADADWDSGAILGANNGWRRSVYSTADAILAELAPALELRDALQALFDDYKSLADSGDAGFWSLEDTPVGKQALAALAQTREIGE